MLFVSIDRQGVIPKDLKAIELRLDLIQEIDFAWIQECIQNHIVLLTPRKFFYFTMIEKLLKLNPDYFDLEWDLNPDWIEYFIQTYPNVKFIISFHRFKPFFDDLEIIYEQMSKFVAFSYKIAISVTSALEALYLLEFGKNHPKVSVICMGKAGEFARVLAPIFGNLINFSCLNSPIAPGQLNDEEMKKVYHYDRLNSETKIFGLIGNPVEQSRGHIFHNGLFKELNLNAIYVKIDLKKEELSEFFSKYGAYFLGLSVTMPLKEEAARFVLNQEPICAINTILFPKIGFIPTPINNFIFKLRESCRQIEDRKWHCIELILRHLRSSIFGALTRFNVKLFVGIGMNVDGMGALYALEKKGAMKGKKIVILGAGGAAIAIAHEIQKQGGQVSIHNRTIERAKKVAHFLNCCGGGLDEIPEKYDVLINTTPVDPQIEILPKTVVMDIVYVPKLTPFLQRAQCKDCQIVFGEEMFYEQANIQNRFFQDVYREHTK